MIMHFIVGYLVSTITVVRSKTQWTVMSNLKQYMPTTSLKDTCLLSCVKLTLF